MALEIIFDQIGGFGRFQVLLIVLVYGMKLMIAWSTMMMSYAAFRNEHACVMESVFNQSELENMDESEVWRLAELGINNQSLIGACKVDGVSCQQFYFFGSKRTITSEWSLVCDLRWMKATITSIQFGGVLAGAVIGGQSGDYFGRKRILYGAYLLHAILNVIAAFSTSWQMFAVMRFLIGTMIGILLVIIVPYCTEFFPLKWRHTIPGIPLWPIGICCFAGVAWLVEDWTYLHLICAILAMPGLLGYFLIPDSPSWLATRGRVDEAHAVLEKMARWNGYEVPATAGETLRKIATQEKTTGKGKGYSYLDLFKNADSAKVTIIAGFQWFVLAMVGYGLGFAVTGFAGNLYLNIFLMNVVSIPGKLCSFFFTNRIGRRWTSLLFLGIAVTVSFVCVGLHMKAPQPLAKILISYLCLMAKLAISAGWVAAQTWTTESYPTVTRSLGFGFVNTMARVGAMTAPFVINLEDLPLMTFVIMGSTGAISMLMTFHWPETRNMPMAETVFERKGITSSLPDGNKLDLEGQTSLAAHSLEKIAPVGLPSTITCVGNDEVKDVSLLGHAGREQAQGESRKSLTRTHL